MVMLKNLFNKRDKHGQVLKPVTIWLAEQHLSRLQHIAHQHETKPRYVIELACIKGIEWVDTFFACLSSTTKTNGKP